MNTSFQFNPKLDLSFIPFMPATVFDDVELRFQVRRLKPNERLDLITSIDGQIIIKVDNYDFDEFAFFKHVQKYTAGKHDVIFKYKSSNETDYTISKIEFDIERDRKPLLQGGFIMLGPPNDRIPCNAFCQDTKKMTDSDWANYIDELDDIGIKCIIVKVTVQLDYMGGKCTAHYTSSLYPRSDITAKDPIRAILTSAEKNGQCVFIGLGHTFYGTLPNTPDVMTELYDLYGDSPAFYGWYGSEEVNMSKNKKSVWKKWDEIYRRAQKLSPVKPFIISPYADITIDDKTDVLHPGFLNKLSSGFGKFDIIAPQDMVGHTVKDGRLTTERTAKMFKILESCCQKAGKHLWANCEAFDFDDNNVLVPRFINGGFDGENGYVGQLTACAPFVEKIITFMFNGFFAPPNFKPLIGGKPAIEQYQNYKNYRDKTIKNS